MEKKHGKSILTLLSLFRMHSKDLSSVERYEKEHKELLLSRLQKKYPMQQSHGLLYDSRYWNEEISKALIKLAVHAGYVGDRQIENLTEDLQKYSARKFYEGLGNHHFWPFEIHHLLDGTGELNRRFAKLLASFFEEEHSLDVSVARDLLQNGKYKLDLMSFYEKDSKKRKSRQKYETEYRQRPGVKKKLTKYWRIHRQKPEIKETRSEYFRIYHQNPEVKKRKKKYLGNHFKRRRKRGKLIKETIRGMYGGHNYIQRFAMDSDIEHQALYSITRGSIVSHLEELEEATLFMAGRGRNISPILELLDKMGPKTARLAGDLRGRLNLQAGEEI
ncbi:MAG: hypothetical protein HYX24_04080 [Candidatus Aenigmarchaeota archaeon]|nr:hypothetical protein [Candidatus Aenigmarchaeota archaeon]